MLFGFCARIAMPGEHSVFADVMVGVVRETSGISALYTSQIQEFDGTRSTAPVSLDFKFYNVLLLYSSGNGMFT